LGHSGIRELSESNANLGTLMRKWIIGLFKKIGKMSATESVGGYFENNEIIEAS
jgi:hypothetical protein